jgi:hypothetical protein
MQIYHEANKIDEFLLSEKVEMVRILKLNKIVCPEGTDLKSIL